MEAFTLLKFWHISPANLPSSDADSDSDADSFFDLDLNTTTTTTNTTTSDTENDRFYDPQSPNSKPHSPISFLRSPPKFPVFTLFKKPQSTESKLQSKRFEASEVPISSLLSRNVSSGDRKLRRQVSGGSSSSKRFVVQKYLKLIKPLYVRVSKRYSDKMSFSFYDSSSAAASPASSPAPAPRKSEERSRVNQLRSVTKHLGKCRSASSAVGMVTPTAAVCRRDDSLLEDGIQSAILHCKRSYDAKRDLSTLSRCVSDPCYYEISIEPYRKSTGEGMKRSSI